MNLDKKDLVSPIGASRATKKAIIEIGAVRSWCTVSVALPVLYMLVSDWHRPTAPSIDVDE